MSLPQYPSTPDLTRQTAVNQIIASIASEELALSHVLNAEGEKIQYAVGALEGLVEPATLAEVLDVNASANNLIQSVLENQILLNGKLSDALQAPVLPGPTGPTGPTGPVGALGAVGVAGFAANTVGGLITVLVAGTPISLPNAQLMSPDITLTSGNTLFTVNTAGFYRISYHVNTTATVLLGTRLVVNAGNLTPSIIPPALSTSQFYNEVEVGLAAGSTIQLQMYAPLIVGAATLLGGSLGASLMIIRLN